MNGGDQIVHGSLHLSLVDWSVLGAWLGGMALLPPISKFRITRRRLTYMRESMEDSRG